MGSMLDSNGTPTFDWTDLDALDNYLKGVEQMSNGKIYVDTPAVPEVGYEKPADRLAVPNRFVDVREVTNLVRYATYQVDNMAAIITEDIAEGQAAAAMLQHAASGLAGSVTTLGQIAGGGK